MEIEFDEAKRIRTRELRGLDFRDAVLILKGRHLVSPARTTEGEERWLATGLLVEAVVTIVFTLRGTRVRVISMRAARDDEKQRYEALYRG